MTVLCTFVLWSTMLFAGGTWDPLPAGGVAALHTLYMRVHRRIAGRPRRGDGSDVPGAAVIEELGVPDAAARLRGLRLICQ